MSYTLGDRSRRGGWGFVSFVVVAVILGAGALALWGALFVGPAPQVTLDVERATLGADAEVSARFSVPRGGLGEVRLELSQGERAVVLAEEGHARPGWLGRGGGRATAEAVLTARIGREHQPWLEEGDVTLRAIADRSSGPLRASEPVVVERRLVVDLRPPELEILSKQHYVRQGGSGLVTIRVGADASRSGVRAGEVESISYPLPGGGAGGRFVLYAIPWDLATSDVRAFAEDAAGNRVETAFVDGFRSAPPRTDRIQVSDGFLEKVVPAIAAATPEVPSEGSLVERYVWINDELRRRLLARIRDLCADTEERFLWSGAFLQMPHTARKASFAQKRTYVYDGREIDHQTHLGLDLASTARAEVPAANGGRVLFAGWLGIYGNAVLLDHGFGLASLYGHLSSVAVRSGEEVARGQAVGHSGETGLAGGDHLHFEIFVQGTSVDPLEWLDPAWIRDRVADSLGEAGGELTR